MDSRNRVRSRSTNYNRRKSFWKTATIDPLQSCDLVRQRSGRKAAAAPVGITCNHKKHNIRKTSKIRTCCHNKRSAKRIDKKWNRVITRQFTYICYTHIIVRTRETQNPPSDYCCGHVLYGTGHFEAFSFNFGVSDASGWGRPCGVPCWAHDGFQ